MHVTGGRVSVHHQAQHQAPSRLGLQGYLKPYLATTLRILRQLAADHRSIATERLRAHGCEHRIAILRRNQHSELSFIGEIQRIQTQDFAGTAHRIGNRQCRFVQMQTEAALGGEFA